MKRIVDRYRNGNLVLQIIAGLILGVLLALVSKDVAISVGVLGDLFVKALKGIAPILVFILVIVAIATKPMDVKTDIKPILLMYLVGTFLAAIAAVIASFIFPIKIVLGEVHNAVNAPTDVFSVLKGVVFNMVDNPVNALATSNFMGVLAWGIGIGIALHLSSTNATKELLKDVNDASLKLVRFIIKLAPFGIFGLMAKTFAETGVESLLSYGALIVLLVATMLFVCFVINPIIMYAKSRRNPYPLIWVSLKESGLTAFFTRSSAANTPVNLALCEKMCLHKDTYSISIPLGATINMSGAAVVITILTLSTAYTVGIDVTFSSAIILCIIASFAACGVSGVAGGSLMLIPLACSLFNIDNNIAMQVVAIGFIIGVIQDSVETALNSATDVMFTAAASQTPPNLDFDKE